MTEHELYMIAFRIIAAAAIGVIGGSLGGVWVYYCILDMIEKKGRKNGKTD